MNRMPKNPTTQLAIPEILLTAIAIIALLLVNKLGVVGNMIFFATLVVMIVSSPEMAFRALTLCLLGLISNQAVVLKGPLWTYARLLIPALCFARFFVDLAKMRQPVLRPRYMAALMAFIIVAGILSVITNYFVYIALLKLVNFTIGSFAMLFGARVITLRRTDMTPWLVAVTLAVVLIGFASLPLEIGYNFRGDIERANGLFNGPFYHSNTLGPLSAMMALLMACVVVFGPYRNRWLCVVLGASLLFFMLLTRSRTGFGTFAIGFLVLVISTLVLHRRGLLRLRMRVSRFALVGCLILGGVFALGYDVATDQKLTRAVVSFAQKGKQTEELSMKNVLASRQGLINYMWENFLASPWIGIGFEVSKHPYFQQNATLFNAPIEKGFLPVAVLEETGIIGTTFFVLFLLAFALNLARNLNVPGLTMFLAFLVVNCGEAMFFSLGGHGAFGWLLMMGGMMFGQQCVVRMEPRERVVEKALQQPRPIPHLQPSYSS